MPSTTPENHSENLKKVSLILFILLGLIHILSGFLMTNGIGLPYSFIVNHVMEIPFAMTAVIYGLASIRAGRAQNEAPQKESHKIINGLFIALTLLIFTGLVYINIFVPDKITT